jgi:hypothetical protein
MLEQRKVAPVGIGKDDLDVNLSTRQHVADGWS